MNPDNIFPILMIFGIAGACLLGSLVLLGLGWFLMRFIRRGENVFQAANQALSEPRDVFFSEAELKLLRWEADALGDFASYLAIDGRRIGPSLHYRGTLKSLDQPEAFGWLAFDLQLKFGKGSMEVCTQKSSYLLEIRTHSAEVRVDGIPLGAIQTQGKQVTLLGVDQRTYGVYVPPPNRDIRYKRTGYFEPRFGPLKLGDRQVAELDSNLILSQHLSDLENSPGPLYRGLVADLTSEEIDWFLALTGLVVYYCIARHLSDKTRRQH